MYLRRMSNVSKASQLCPTQTSRSISTTRLSDVCRHGASIRKYHTGRASVTDIEQTVPFTNTLLTAEPTDGQTERDTKDIEVMDVKCDSANESLLGNGHATFNDGKVELKINVVNIECKSRDGMSTQTTSLDIQTVKNGQKISEKNILNNNVDDGEERQSDTDDSLAFADDPV